MDNTMQPGEYAKWKNKTAQFIVSQSISQIGSSIVRYAILWYITLETGSGTMMTVATICSFLPQFIISFFSGSWADKFNRKTVIILSDLFTAFCSLTLAILMFLDLGSLWLMFVVSALGSLGAGIQAPAVGAILPQLVPKEKLLAVNGVSSGLQPIVTIVAPFLAALVLATTGIYVIFAIDVFTALTAAIILAALRAGKKSNEAHQEDVGMRAGLQYMRKKGYIIPMIVFAGLLMFFVSPAALLTPLHVKRVFGDSQWYLMWMEIGFSAGMILGGMLTSTLLKKRNKSHLVSISTFILGALSAALALATFNFVAYCAVTFVIGLFVPIMNVPMTTLLQENTDPSMMGRVFAFFTMVSTCMFPVGMLLFGPLADVININYLLIGTGAAQCLLVIFALKGSWNKLRQTPQADPATNPAE